jgi:hypothetical protein
MRLRDCWTVNDHLELKRIEDFSGITEKDVIRAPMSAFQDGSRLDKRKGGF